MKISVITTLCNSGAQYVRDTIESARRSLGTLEHEFVVVNDCSEDDSCNGVTPDANLFHNETRLGCSGSRHKGGLQATGDVLIWTDPHCSFPAKSLESVAYAARSSCRSVIQPAIVHEGQNSKRKWWRVVTSGDGLKVIHSKRCVEYPAMCGALFAMNRQIWVSLGCLPSLPGWWGWFELFHTTLVYRMGFKVVQIDCGECIHRAYRKRYQLPFSLPGNHVGRNAHWYYGTLLPQFYQRMLKQLKHRKLKADYSDFETREFSDLRDWVEGGSVQSEKWFLNNVVGSKPIEN